MILAQQQSPHYSPYTPLGTLINVLASEYIEFILSLCFKFYSIRIRVLNEGEKKKSQFIGLWTVPGSFATKRDGKD